MAHRVEETVWIPLPDGTRLAARIWRPEGEAAVPAVLEYLPYRRRDVTAPRDESTYPDFAEAGIAGVRVDSRGNGDSGGRFDDEYSPTELADACAVIAWIAEQDWCSGAVGMMGISWGGFNALQVAALRPPALKAVISIASTVDRHADDIHYKGGCLLSANVYWAGQVFSNTARPPDPAVVGEAWEAIWRERLETIALPLEPWLAHQRRDAYWRHGSVCEDWSAIEIPVWIIGGWADGYVNAPAALLENGQSHVRAMVGPWIHKYPHFAWPRPRADFVAMAVDWWRAHLGGEETAARAWPAYRAWIAEAILPGGFREREHGRWVGLEAAPAQVCRAERMSLGADRALGSEARGVLTLKSPQTCGLAGGEFFTSAPDAYLPGDQRVDDALSLAWETQALEAPLDLLGRAAVELSVAVDRPQANLIARLVDVHPDGTSALIAKGMLNLCHRDGPAEPSPMTPGEPARVRILLDECGYRLRPGHRLRLALSTAYWPMVLPSPEAATATVQAGPEAVLTLPVLPEGAGAETPPPYPEDDDPLPEYPRLSEGHAMRDVRTDLQTGRTTYHIREDTGLLRHPGHGLAWRETRDESWEIDPADPEGTAGRLIFTTLRQRDDVHATTRAEIAFSCRAEVYAADVTLTAENAGTEIFRRTWSLRTPRDHV